MVTSMHDGSLNAASGGRNDCNGPEDCVLSLIHSRDAMRDLSPPSSGLGAGCLFATTDRKEVGHANPLENGAAISVRRLAAVQPAFRCMKSITRI